MGDVKDGKVTCPKCKGLTGPVGGGTGAIGTCISCQGSGESPDYLHGGTIKCRTCNGTKKTWNRCSRCSGTGWIYPGETAPGDPPQGDQGGHTPDGSEPRPPQ